jgi:AcrR family transcriptional regulator
MGKPQASKPSAKDAILAAASTVARERGVLGLSIDRIIELAGLSKGGFFYHFPTKDALIQAVVTVELDRFESVIDEHIADGRTYAESLIEALLEFVSSNGALLGSVNAALAFGEPIKALVVQRHDKWIARLREEIASDTDETLLGLAIDGLIFSCSYRAGPPTKSEQALIRRALQGLVR